MTAYSVSGTPADCVKIALECLLNTPPDLVLSGINNGPNLGTDILYSGTVAAAIEASILGIPAIAISMVDTQSILYDQGAEYIKELLEKIQKVGIASDTLLNINIPNIDKKYIRGTKITTMGIRKYTDSFTKRQDPRGGIYYWLAGKAMEFKNHPESDIETVKKQYVSITPLHYDLTAYKKMEMLRELELF